MTFLLISSCFKPKKLGTGTIVAFEKGKHSIMWIRLDNQPDSGLICKVKMGKWMEPYDSILGNKITLRYYKTSTDVGYAYLSKYNSNSYSHRAAIHEEDFICMPGFENIKNQ